MTRTSAVVVFGGTFNPVHNGHLQSAIELRDRYPISEVRFMPAANPPHRDQPQVSAEDRATMVELAIAELQAFTCDRRELGRTGPSYTLLSLQELRQELGPTCSLTLLLGTDAFSHIGTWHRWEEIFDYANLLVMHRPPIGASKSQDPSTAAGNANIGTMAGAQSELAERLPPEIPIDKLWQHPLGGLARVRLKPHAISSTEIRALLQSGRKPSTFTPRVVADFIEAKRLYL
ncbi:MAG: nicotinate-nucleotide adenylyltransferase [Pseudomonadota bacterium]